MKKTALLAVILAVGLSGCNGAFLGGTGAGVAGTGAGYELRARHQMQKIEEDRDAGRISQEEYEIRKSQIKSMSIAY